MGGSTILRSAASSLVGQALPLGIALVTMPLVVAALGHAEFGILSIVWTVLGHFAIFDLGFARATTHSVAKRLGTGQTERIPGLLGTASRVQFGLGLLGALGVASLAPWLAHSVLNMGTTGVDGVELAAVAQACLGLIACSVPIVLAEGTLRGGLEAHQRFDLINRVRIPVSVLGLVLPWLGAIAGYGLPQIVGALVCLRCVALGAYRFQLAKLPGLGGWRLPFERRALKELVSFGVWAGVTSAIGPVLAYLERFLIASQLSVGALALYALPMEALSRLLVIPSSLASALFPALGGLGPKRLQESAAVYLCSTRILLLLCLPLALLGAALAELGLYHWAGAEFAQRCTGVTRILIVVVLLNALSLVPFSVVQGLGKPKWKARLDLVELPLFALLAWILIGKYGLIGAATAKLIVATVDFLALHFFSMKLTKTPARRVLLSSLAPALFPLLLMISLTALSIFGLSTLPPAFTAGLPIVGVTLAYGFSVRIGLTPGERQQAAQLLHQALQSLRPQRVCSPSKSQ